MTQESLKIKTATKDDWHDLQEMPAKSEIIDLEPHFYDPEDVIRMKRGFIPKEMEQKWFIYCTDEYIYLHRSWTGILVYKVYIYEGEDGDWVITCAEINRDPDQYGGTDNAEDERIIFELIDEYLFKVHGEYQSSFLSGVEAALKPNYLGNPEVVAKVLTPFFDALINYLKTKFESKNTADAAQKLDDENRKLCDIFSGSHPEYNVVGTWNSEKELGQVVIKCFDLDPDHYRDENMYYILSSGFIAVKLAVIESIDSGKTNNDAESILELLLNMHKFVTCVLLGTYSVTHPNITLEDF